MDVPVIGVLIMIVGSILALCSGTKLYDVLIISTTFSATAVANVKWHGEEKGIPAWLFLELLLLVRLVVQEAQPMWRRGLLQTREFRVRLWVFWAALVASLCTPLFSGGSAWVKGGPAGESVPLKLGVANVTQTLYVTSGLVLAAIVAAHAVDENGLIRDLRLYVKSCLFGSVWGLFQFWCNITGHNYPAHIFNTNATETAKGYMQRIDAFVGRVSSIALEPSVFAQELLLAFVILYMSMRVRRPLFSTANSTVALLVLVAGLMVSTSTTAYVGTVLALLISGITGRRILSKKPPGLRGVIVATGVVVCLFVAADFLWTGGVIIQEMLFSKRESFSYFQRLMSIEIGVEEFIKHPILGTGWHYVTVSDLVFLLLANLGLVGFLSFCWVVWGPVRRLWRLKVSRGGTYAIVVATVLCALVLAEMDGLTYSAGYFWFVLGTAGGTAFRMRARWIGPSAGETAR